MRRSSQIKLLILFIGLSISLSSAQDIKPKVTMLEIGSTTCIPCKKMQPVMKSLENRFGSQLKIIFIDSNKNKDVSKQYGIKLIPTQIFLDADGKEFHRHEGFYPEKKITQLLKSKGLK